MKIKMGVKVSVCNGEKWRTFSKVNRKISPLSTIAVSAIAIPPNQVGQMIPYPLKYRHYQDWELERYRILLSDHLSPEAQMSQTILSH
jgi:hypothetical protein